MYEYRQSFMAWDPATWSFYVGQMFGIRVRIHVTLMFVLVVMLLSSLGSSGLLWVSFAAITFFSVLFHEFGHCFACRAVGGEARDVVMHPLGGLALTAPPDRAMAHLITTVGGPAVNLAVVFITLPILIAFGAFTPEMLYPFSDFKHLLAAYQKVGVVAIIYEVNYSLMLFNLLPMLPLDGGRITEELLWFRMRHSRARIIACNIGMFTAGFLIALSLWFNTLISALIPVLCLFHCIQLKRITEMMGDFHENEFGYDFSQGYTSLERSMGGPLELRKRKSGFSLFGWYTRWREKKRAEREAKVEEEVDRILAKIHESGLESLTRAEKKLLTEASRHRQRH